MKILNVKNLVAWQVKATNPNKISLNTKITKT